MGGGDILGSSGAVLVGAGAEGDLVVLNHDDHGHTQPRGKDQALVTGGGSGGPVPGPGERDPLLATVPEGQGRAGRDRYTGAHVADGLNNAPGDIAVVKVPSELGLSAVAR